ncbi:MAG: hypothetical protein KKA79_07200 [Nanoarchaeota archaeon]|nr:hypothetical protein [Nanoarchaeota archaeon]
MVTTIQITQNLQSELTERKLFDRETYEEVIWDLIEDTKELNKETKKELEQARAEIKSGKFYTLSQIKKELGI